MPQSGQSTSSRGESRGVAAKRRWPIKWSLVTALLIFNGALLFLSSDLFRLSRVRAAISRGEYSRALAIGEGLLRRHFVRQRAPQAIFSRPVDFRLMKMDPALHRRELPAGQPAPSLERVFRVWEEAAYAEQSRLMERLQSRLAADGLVPAGVRREVFLPFEKYRSFLIWFGFEPDSEKWDSLMSRLHEAMWRLDEGQGSTWSDYDRGMEAFFAHRYPEALEALESFSDRVPNHWPTLRTLHMLYHRTGDSLRLPSIEERIDGLIPDHVVNIPFGDSMLLGGYDLSPNPLRREGPFTLTLYWKAIRTVPDLVDGLDASIVLVSKRRKSQDPLVRLASSGRFAFPKSGESEALQAGQILKRVYQMSIPTKPKSVLQFGRPLDSPDALQPGEVPGPFDMKVTLFRYIPSRREWQRWELVGQAVIGTFELVD